MVPVIATYLSNKKSFKYPHWSVSQAPGWSVCLDFASFYSDITSSFLPSGACEYKLLTGKETATDKYTKIKNKKACRSLSCKEVNVPF